MHRVSRRKVTGALASRFRKLNRAVVESLEERRLLATGVIINEFMASNSTGYQDPAFPGQHPDWIDRVVDSLGETVYITIDVDGLDPAIMPATGTPEPGGLTWYELLALLRKVIEQRTVVGCDIVELAPMAGNIAP